jgi:hypothetical protein
MRSNRRRLVVATGVLAALAGLAGVGACSGGGSSSSQSADAGAVSGETAGTADTASKAVSTAPGRNRPAVRTPSVIRTGEITVTGRNLDALRGDVTDLVAALGGTLQSEETSDNRRGEVAESTLVLRIPVARFDAAKRALEKLGTLRYSNESAKDVTTEVIDTDERVQTLQNSLDRLQRFQRSATDVADLLRYEDQITRRQSELQSTQAQQTYLADQTSMSTITVHLSTPDDPGGEPGVLADAGFLSGLRGGWHALQDVVVVALTLAGALLPFLLALAVLGVPGWLLLRGLWRRRGTPAPPAPPTPAES